MEALNWKAVKKFVSYWLTYIGIRRLVSILSASLVIAIVGWLFVRPTAPLPESVVPRASGVGAVPSSAVPTPSTVKVHVAGAVKHPGVYQLSSSSRVDDAVRAAGGATERADLERINLAQTIVDTEQVYVPTKKSSSPRITVSPRLRPSRTTVPAVVPTVPGAPTPATVATGPGKVNLNTATSDQLDALPGVGPATAKAILSYRSRKGSFAKIDDLLNVPGIGPAKVAAIRDFVTVG
jgi:competence protein ComEA